MSNSKNMKTKNVVPIILAIVAACVYIAGRIGYLYGASPFYDKTFTGLPITEIVYRLVWTIPYILLVIHLILYQIRKIRIVFSLVFVFELFLLVFSRISYGWNIYSYMDILAIVECAGYGVVAVISLLSITKRSSILVCSLCILGLINVIYFVSGIVDIYSLFDVIPFYLLCVCLGNIGSVPFYIACILHIVLINRKKEVAAVDSSAIEFEQMLVQIKQQYDEGIITEQEYRNRKKKIIAKL